MFIGADYPFLDVLWTMFVFVASVIWFWLLIPVFADISAAGHIGVLEGAVDHLRDRAAVPRRVHLPDRQQSGEADRSVAQMQTQQAATDEYIRSVSGGSVAEIEKGKALLDSGAITQAEFDGLKVRDLSA